MKKLMIIAITICLFSTSVFSQIQTKIGELINNSPIFTVDISVISNAIMEELNDGTNVVDIFIEKDQQNNWYIISHSEINNIKKTCSFLLNLSTNGEFRLSTNEPKYRLCGTTTCINFCNWEVCSCTTGIPGQVCEISYPNLTNGPGYIGSFY